MDRLPLPVNQLPLLSSEGLGAQVRVGTGQELPAVFWVPSSQILLEVPEPNSYLDLPRGLASGSLSFPAEENPRSLPPRLGCGRSALSLPVGPRGGSLDWVLHLTSDPLPPGAAGITKDPDSCLVWEVSPGTLALPGCPEAFLVTHSGAPTSSGLGLLSGSGSKKLCPQLTWKAVSAGAMPWDRPPPGPGLGHRGPGVLGS